MPWGAQKQDREGPEEIRKKKKQDLVQSSNEGSTDRDAWSFAPTAPGLNIDEKGAGFQPHH